MRLRLKYDTDIYCLPQAALIRGSSPDSWLKEINRWNIQPDELNCYAIPRSINSSEAAGLLVIFNDQEKAKRLTLLAPFRCIHEKLFIPANTELLPQLSKEEFQNIFIYDAQLFHPITGLIGFDERDKINLTELLLFNEKKPADWSFAHPGIPGKPEFRQINIVQPSSEEIIESIKKNIGKKTLTEIPGKGDDDNAFDKIADFFKTIFFGGIAELLKISNKFFAAPNASAINTSGKKNVFQKFEKWVNTNLEELQRKRDDEIKRLLDLLDKNTNEGLQYAIPLNSPYLNRGQETRSSTLKRNPLNLNFGNLGGGSRADFWDIGDRYNDLRTKYLKAAQKEIEQKDFKKAAYVYAHLLGDFYSAANTLEQGKMFREAAALYKDHLNNKVGAAECLERGGLYIEAIEFYKDLSRDEKVGDLYKTLHEKENAVYYYEKYIAAKLGHADYLDAARVIDEKMDNEQRALETLLAGWENSYMHENCLKKYFEIQLRSDSTDIEQKIKHVYRTRTPKNKNISLLNVLEYITKKKKKDEIISASLEIAYEIAHDETERKNTNALFSLKKFLPDDTLLHSDINRYTNALRNHTFRKKPDQVFYLDTSIKWLKAVGHRNQFLVLGVKDACLQMARGNWYGNFEYYSWTNPVKFPTGFHFINAPYYSNHIFLHSTNNEIPVSRKNLPKNKYFTEALIVNCPIWLHKGTSRIVIDGEQNISRLDSENNAATLHHYTKDGDLKKSIHCFLENTKASLAIGSSGFLTKVQNGPYYTWHDKFVISISEDGKTNIFQLDTLIRFCAFSASINDFRLIISTNKGCLLAKPSVENFNMGEQFFATDITPGIISFLSADTFVIVEKRKALLFQIADNNPFFKKKLEAGSVIIAALPTSDRHSFALIEESGKITFCEIE